MRKQKNPSVHQINQGEWQTNQGTLPRVPPNHRLAERIVIKAVLRGELEIDTSGRVWRVGWRRRDRTYPCKKRRAEHKACGYLQVRIMEKGKRVNASAHRLIWQYINGDIPPGLTINHKNGKKTENWPDNLELATYSDQMKHAHKTGLSSQWGVRNHQCKLTDEQVLEMRTLYATGDYKQGILAKQFGISFQTASRILRGEERVKIEGPTSTANRDYGRKRDPVTNQYCK